MCLAFLSRLVMCLVALFVCFSSAKARDLRVCADPNNLPFSKSDGSGFENRIAAVVAKAMGATLSYTWFAQRRGFLRNTLNGGKCDVVMGYPENYKQFRSTRPYYRSSYVFVQRAGEVPIRSFDDPALRRLKIGVQLVGHDGANTPPVQAFARRGIVSNVRGFLVYGDYRSPAPLSPIVEAVAKGDVDVAIVWGPIAGYFAQRQDVPLTLTPVLFDPANLSQPMSFDIVAGVRKEDVALAQEINAALGAHSREIDDILKSYGVPRTDSQTITSTR